MPGWDYSGNGFYYITIMVQHRKCLFGKIENDKMVFSDFGKIANNEWYMSFEIRQELILDEFILMPNHLHAIVVIKKPDGLDVEMHGRASLQPDQSQQSNPHETNPKFHRKPKSISSFIAGYKSVVTTKIDDFIDLHKLPIEKYNRENKLWQSNYHDHIIRNNDEYWRIKNYIRNNPKNWTDDDLFE